VTARGGIVRATVAKRVYEELRVGILDGRYRLNQHLVETDLAEDLSSSRTPIRQALQRLELEGLVTATRSGWAVREHSIAEVIQIYDVRVPLEGYVARLAAERATADELAVIADINEELATLHDPEVRQEYARVHDALHEAIVLAAQNDILREAVRGYRAHPYNRRVAHLYSDAQLRTAERSHAALVAAIGARDVDTAEALGREHLDLSRQVTIQRLRNLG
jgi:DNA-binding GntR family transcriptional regulator